MATLIKLGSRGVNLDTLTGWRDGMTSNGAPELTLYFDADNAEDFHGEEREKMLQALTLNSMEY